MCLTAPLPTGQGTDRFPNRPTEHNGGGKPGFLFRIGMYRQAMPGSPQYRRLDPEPATLSDRNHTYYNVYWHAQRGETTGIPLCASGKVWLWCSRPTHRSAVFGFKAAYHCPLIFAMDWHYCLQALYSDAHQRNREIPNDIPDEIHRLYQHCHFRPEKCW